jgi:protein O-GlcNAc transferase
MTTPAEALAMAWNYHRAGALPQAEQLYRQALQLRPDSAEAHTGLANVLLEQGRFDEALARYREVLRLRPDSPDAHFNLGLALKRQGQLDDAVASYREALRLRPDFAEAWNNLGTVRAAQGDGDDARTCFERALQFNPSHPPAHNNLGKLYQEQGRLDEAEARFREALRLRPHYAEAHYNLGVLFQQERRLDEAAACFRAAVQYRPGFTEALNNLGNVLRDLGQVDEARTCFEQALQVRPDFADAWANLGFLDKAQGRPAEAEAHFREAHRLRPSDRLRVEAATLLPPVYQSLDELDTWRTRLTENLQRLHADGVRLDLTHEPAPTLFYLAYQGRNDRDLQRTFADLCVPPPGPPPQPSAGGKIRVGFLSSHFRNHTVGRLTQGLVAHLDRATFTVVVLSLGRYEDETAEFFRRHADAFVELPANLPLARRLVADQRLDVLFYSDIGLDPLTSSLAFSRLAPVQCVTWGHPVTTGIPALDYFVSSDLLETDGAEEHYTERLVRLPSLAVCYPRPELPAALRRRSHFGLSDEGRLYACPQSLFKLHPDFDAVLGGILRRDPQGTVALLHGWSRHWDDLLRQRFAVTLPDVMDRIRFVPPLSRAEFLNLNAVADVLLDPLHFGGGNSSYEGLALGVPIVTLPSPFLRGRITLALYRQMQVFDCVVSSAEEYVDKAVRLGMDADYRAAVRAEIRDVSGVLFENTAGVRELERFLRAARAG